MKQSFRFKAPWSTGGGKAQAGSSGVWGVSNNTKSRDFRILRVMIIPQPRVIYIYIFIITELLPKQNKAEESPSVFLPTEFDMCQPLSSIKQYGKSSKRRSAAMRNTYHVCTTLGPNEGFCKSLLGGNRWFLYLGEKKVQAYAQPMAWIVSHVQFGKSWRFLILGDII